MIGLWGLIFLSYLFSRIIIIFLREKSYLFITYSIPWGIFPHHQHHKMPGVKRTFETAEEESQQEEQSAKKAKLPGDHSKLTERLNKLNNKQLRWVFIEI